MKQLGRWTMAQQPEFSKNWYSAFFTGDQLDEARVQEGLAAVARRVAPHSAAHRLLQSREPNSPCVTAIKLYLQLEQYKTENIRTQLGRIQRVKAYVQKEEEDYGRIQKCMPHKVIRWLLLDQKGLPLESNLPPWLRCAKLEETSEKSSIQFTGTPASDDEGTFTVRITSQSGRILKEFMVEVAPASDPPA